MLNLFKYCFPILTLSIFAGMSGMSLSLTRMVETMDGHLRVKLLNAAKMYLYLLYETLRALEEKFNAKTDSKLAVDAKVLIRTLLSLV